MSSGIQIRGRVAWRGRLPLRSLAAVAVHELEVEEAVCALGRFVEDIVRWLGLQKLIEQLCPRIAACAGAERGRGEREA